MHGKAKSIEREGFEFVKVDLSNFDQIKSHRWLRDKPQWFKDEYVKGNIMPVKNSKECHVIMRNENSTFECYDGSYIVRDPSGELDWKSSGSFNKGMEVVKEL